MNKFLSFYFFFCDKENKIKQWNVASSYCYQFEKVLYNSNNLDNGDDKRNLAYIPWTKHSNIK